MMQFMTQSTKNHNVPLISGHRLAWNTIWNLIGTGSPVLVAIFCIPLLIRGLGTDRFGVLTLVWAVIGYASLFDLGLGRALTQVVARKIGAGEDHEVPVLVWTSLLLMLVLGLIGTAVVVSLSPWLVHSLLDVPSALQRETIYSFYALGISIPIVITTDGLRGVLEAQQRFGIINTLRVPMGLFLVAGPLVVLPFSKNLFPVVVVLVIGRLIACVVHLLVCLQVMPALRHRIAWQRAVVSPLLHLGGWMTVSNVLGPLMVTLDRFLIGALLSISVVAYYTTPYEVVTKFWLIPGAVVGVLFPAFSTSSVQDRNRMRLLFVRSVKYLVLILFPMVLLTVVLAQDGLKLWLGLVFAQRSVRVLQWLAIGVFVNSLAQIPFALVQGVGRPDLTAKLHLIEAPAYLAALWWLIKTHGIEGAAIAWTVRTAVDALVLFGLAGRFLPGGTPFRSRTLVLVALVLVTLGLATLPQGLILKGIFLLLTILTFSVATWFLVLSPEERSLALGFL